MLRFVAPAVSRSVASTAMAAGVSHSSTLSSHESSDCDNCDTHVTNVNNSDEAKKDINLDNNATLQAKLHDNSGKVVNCNSNSSQSIKHDRVATAKVGSVNSSCNAQVHSCRCFSSTSSVLSAVKSSQTCKSGEEIASPLSNYRTHFTSRPASMSSTSAQYMTRRFASTEGKDYYKILGISKSADLKEIKKAYRKRALETHPDQGGNKEEFAEIAEAYEVLSSPEKRQIYDQYGSEAATNPNMGGMGGSGFAGGRSAEDIFAEFFKGGFGDMFGGMGGSGSMNRGPPTVQPLEVRLRLSLEEVYTGVHKDIRVTRPQVCSECNGFGTKSKQEKPKCTQCNGNGHVIQQHRMGPGMVQQTISECPLCHGTGNAAKPEDTCARCHGKGYRSVTQEVAVDIPAGVPSNVTLVIRGEGGTIPKARPGDLHVHVEVNPHKSFQRRGDDLIVEKEISLEEALLGMHLPLKLLDGRSINVETSAEHILKPDGVIKVAGEGMPNTSGGRGDIYIFLSLKMPRKLTQEQKDLVQRAFGAPHRDPHASPGNTVKGRVMRETKEQLEEQKRNVWAAQESGTNNRGGGFSNGEGFDSGFANMGMGGGGGGNAGRGRRQGGGMPHAECATQ